MDHTLGSRLHHEDENNGLVRRVWTLTVGVTVDLI